jgi:hypothetical protein
MVMGWQNAASLAIVTVAALYLIRRVWSSFRPVRAAGCAKGCGNCPAAPTSAPLEVVAIGGPRPASTQSHRA